MGGIFRMVYDITTLINLFRLRGEAVAPRHNVKACRDSQDDKFFEVALSGEADSLVSGDSDLLSMNPFKSIPILAPIKFLAII